MRNFLNQKKKLTLHRKLNQFLCCNFNSFLGLQLLPIGILLILNTEQFKFRNQEEQNSFLQNLAS